MRVINAMRQFGWGKNTFPQAHLLQMLELTCFLTLLYSSRKYRFFQKGNVI
jgi:hypothetical protein